MNAMIRQSHKQYKLLKKFKSVSAFLVPVGVCINIIGFAGSAMTMLGKMPPNLMFISFSVGLPILIVGAILHELANYQEARLRGRVRRYMQLIESIRQRQLEGRRQMKAQKRELNEAFDDAPLTNSSSMLNLSI